MSNNTFFKPAPLYKEFMILDLIEKNKNITQREISVVLGAAVSMVNNYIDDYERKGYIKRMHRSTKTVEYFVTKKGNERRKLLNLWYLKSSQSVYQSAKNNIISFLNLIIEKGFRKILLYGAGEVAEIVLDVIQHDNKLPLEIMAVVDDNDEKAEQIILNRSIIKRAQIGNIVHDGILISSYTHHKVIHEKLLKMGYEENKILHFF